MSGLLNELQNPFCRLKQVLFTNELFFGMDL